MAYKVIIFLALSVKINHFYCEMKYRIYREIVNTHTRARARAHAHLCVERDNLISSKVGRKLRGIKLYQQQRLEYKIIKTLE